MFSIYSYPCYFHYILVLIVYIVVVVVVVTAIAGARVLLFSLS